MADITRLHELLAKLSHELRTPLASMLLNAQRLREDDVPDQAELQRIGDSLERAVQQQTRLIEQWMNASLNAPGELTLERRVEGGGSDSGVERRATWTLTYPLPSDQTKDNRSTPMPARSLDRPGKVKQYDALKDIRILYIDDDFSTREAVLEVLELTGARVALAASTADGMMALDSFKPHVILCDIGMPGEDGYTFMRKLRARETGQSAAIPVLAFTAHASAEDKRHALAAGFQLHLAKPIDIDRLRDSVLQLVALIGTTSATDSVE